MLVCLSLAVCISCFASTVFLLQYYKLLIKLFILYSLMQGRIIYAPELVPNLIVTDVGWFVDTLTRLCHNTSVTLTSDTVTCLVSPTAAWSDKSLHKLKVDRVSELWNSWYSENNSVQRGFLCCILC